MIMDGEFDEFEDLDDDLLRSLPLDDYHTGSDSATQLPGFKQDSHVPLPEFPFPFEPYDIQVGFMHNLYKTLELGKIGIFESPTGTGKSLSVICGALRWLKDHIEQQRLALEEMKAEKPCKTVEDTANSGLDWINDFARKKELDEKSKNMKDEQDAIERRESRVKAMRTQRHTGKRKRDALEDQFDDVFKNAPSDLKEQLAAELEAQKSDDKPEDDDIVLEEYFSDEETTQKVGDDIEDLSEEHVTKIYFCSRTHSQLAQFVREIQKSPYASDTPVVSLGSRQNMCINESVKKLNSVNLMNDRCLELQKNKEKKTDDAEAKRRKSSGGCPFYKQDPMMNFRDDVLAEIGDIEHLVTRAKKMKACPYYGTRYALPAAELVALPYNILLHKSTRMSCGIKLKNNIVIIDEAHNLLDTIANIHSVQITGAQLTCAYSQLSQYQDRYRSRLKAKNLMYIRQLLFLLSTFIKCLGGKIGVPAEVQKMPKTGTRLQTINDFLFDCKMDNLNLFKVLRYCEKSMIARKLRGFAERYQPQVQNTTQEKNEEKPIGSALSRFLKDMNQPKSDKNQNIPESLDHEKDDVVTSLASPLMLILGFLESLTNANKDGRMVINRQDFLNKSSLKFLLLNPAVYFESILSEARSVIVAGGTMEPVSEFKDQLFYAAGVTPDKILHYSCGHVIGSNQLMPMAVKKGPTGLDLDFTYQHRDTTEMMDELGRVVCNVCNVVPGGVVIFLPSYEYEKTLHSHWEKTGCLSRICAKKKVFREPKKSNQVEQLLAEYASFIKKHISNKHSSYTGAMMICVVGGKMSEGINFSDDLGRCVLMVGLPYPNIKSPELKEKMDYLNANMPKASDGRAPGQVHYENLCMKAVNQSIGRAIRHKEDYACILLLDRRYLHSSIMSKLPTWISKQLQNVEQFGKVFANLRKFFMDKKTEIAT